MNHSTRAKKGTADQINAQIKKLQQIVTSKTKEVCKVKSYKKYKLPGYATMLRNANSGLNIAKRDLSTVKTRKSKLQKEGKI